MKSAHAADTGGITGKTRSHIISRLERAASIAEYIFEVLSSSSAAGASAVDILEARAYAALIRGTALFEKQSWEPCVRSFSTAHIIYSTLATLSKEDTYKDLLAETIDPSIRYAAYLLKTPRTVPVAVIALKAFPMSEKPLVQAINNLNPNILRRGDPEARKALPGAEDAPKTLTWRSREVKIEDAAIAIAWQSVASAKTQLVGKLAAADTEPKDVAPAYDEILTASQDAVDATKQALDELRGEGVEKTDSRMQSLEITWTAVNFELVSWRIGRNRVLTGEHDGALEDYPAPGKRRRGKKKEEKTEAASKQAKEEKPARRIARLKERVALYDATLQSLEFVKGLPGMAADERLSGLLDATSKYFKALK